MSLGGTTVFTADDASNSVSLDTSDIDGTTTIKGSTVQVTGTSHAYISAGDTSTGDAGDITLSQVFYGLATPRVLADTDGAVYVNPEIDMGLNLFTTSSYVSDTSNALYAVAGSNSASGLTVTSGATRNIVDVSLDNYRGCKVDVLFEIVFPDGVVIGHQEYLLHYSGSFTSVSSTVSKSSSYSSSTLTFSVSVSSNVFTVYATYTGSGSGVAYSLVELKGGYKAYAVYNS